MRPGTRQPDAELGVADGIRTRDHRDHNPGLYQLSYRHRAGDRIALELGWLTLVMHATRYKAAGRFIRPEALLRCFRASR